MNLRQLLVVAVTTALTANFVFLYELTQLVNSLLDVLESEDSD